MTLREAAKYVGDEKGKGTDPEAIILGMCARFGAKRTLRPWGNTLRCATISASCTWSTDNGLLNAWNRNATIKLALEAMA